ncbi:MAG: Nudix family hydrolase [Burkholderiales bacterium]
MAPPQVDVAAGILVRPDGSVLLGQRPASKVYAGYWEFPGGKVEAGETPRMALDRELSEELGIDVRKAYPWLAQSFTYPHASVRLQFFRVTEWAGDPHAKEHQGLSWQRPGHFVLEPMLPANTPILRALSLPSECAITAVAAMGESAFLKRLDERLAAGLKLVQLREKAMSRADLTALGREVMARAHRHGAMVIVNGDEQVAQTIDADGLHLTSAQLAVAGHRPGFRWVSAACHSADEIQRATRLGIDFAIVGAVNETPTHPGQTGLGWAGFAALVAGASIPVYAIGGVRSEDLETAWTHGAHGIAMIRGAWT